MHRLVKYQTEIKLHLEGSTNNSSNSCNEQALMEKELWRSQGISAQKVKLINPIQRFYT